MLTAPGLCLLLVSVHLAFMEDSFNIPRESHIGPTWSCIHTLDNLYGMENIGYYWLNPQPYFLLLEWVDEGIKYYDSIRVTWLKWKVGEISF
jgi:hypothetical protein